MQKYKTALITGASSGIGAAFAEALAREGVDLILVARSEDRLRTLAGRLTRDHGRNVQVIPADLAKSDAAARLKKSVDALDMPVDLLINNAGFGTTGSFVKQNAAREAEEIRLNAGAVVALAHAFVPGMVERGGGAVINMASVAAFQPMPYFAVYAATKAFVLSFSDALGAELHKNGVQVMAVCPGPVDTAFFEATGNHRLRDTVPKGLMMTAEDVVQLSLKAFIAGKTLVIPGAANRAVSWISRVAPRKLVVASMARVMKR